MPRWECLAGLRSGLLQHISSLKKGTITQIWTSLIPIELCLHISVGSQEFFVVAQEVLFFPDTCKIYIIIKWSGSGVIKQVLSLLVEVFVFFCLCGRAEKPWSLCSGCALSKQAHWYPECYKLVGLQLRGSPAKGGCDLCKRKDSPFLGSGSKFCFSWHPHASVFSQACHQQCFLFIVPSPQRQFSFHCTNGNVWVRLMFKFICGALVEFMRPCQSSINVGSVLWFALKWHQLKWRRSRGENKVTTQVVNNGLGNNRCACLWSTSFSIS